jgi:hypothetical protein
LDSNSQGDERNRQAKSYTRAIDGWYRFAQFAAVTRGDRLSDRASTTASAIAASSFRLPF